MSGSTLLRRIDWLTILLMCSLMLFGWINIYSTTVTEDFTSVFDYQTYYGKQLVFIIISLLVVFPVLIIESSFFERFSSIIYLIAIVLLAGLFVFGKEISGATSWYGLGFFNLQPSEFAKMATALALAKYLSDIQTDIRVRKYQLYATLIILLPALLVLPQPDPGSALVYLSLFFVLFREGLPLYYLFFALILVILFVTTLMFGTIWVAIGLGIFISLFFLLKKPTLVIPTGPLLGFIVVAMTISLSVDFIYTEVFEQRHRDRFDLWLRLEKDPSKLEKIRKSIGYNTYQAEKAIESGGFNGKGFMEGTRTKGKFVPEQHTDYIFSSVGEEWGFIGTAGVIMLFSLLLLRLVFIAERQRREFNRMYGYGVVSILLIHYGVNIGMVLGLLPTIGIPLPFFSYGGSSQLFFSLLIFIMLKLDANRLRDGI
ncbi:rod shape-determining protein RodA [Aureicoccus marinus]|jgi:rod shape determining protein RodA|uniref:Cell wall polymerase n=1 Tax=Aureicoccus marinus TaxID=754435 RepID=A0A2S7T9I2_9FLAO|nr:rod shape-determining protein RodA [Aureicoccus marinus]PQJ16592.1 rod shape-determining protein RodA [Aureicoccus marinus]